MVVASGVSFTKKHKMSPAAISGTNQRKSGTNASE
jgi:hypothetical protein